MRPPTLTVISAWAGHAATVAIRAALLSAASFLRVMIRSILWKKRQGPKGPPFARQSRQRIFQKYDKAMSFPMVWLGRNKMAYSAEIPVSFFLAISQQTT